MPDAGAPRRIEPGVTVREVRLPRGAANRLWIYLPEGGAKNLPCVFVAPAGSPLIHGMELTDDDRPEHIPYVRAGFAVVAYEIDGPLGDNAGDGERLRAAQAFRAADAGVQNARDAVDYALARLPIDPERLYVAGHSSAGTLALLVAENEPRIAACAAYAPCCDVEKRLGPMAISALDSNLPGYAAFLARSSPLNGAARLKCPLMLFHADDDSNVPTSDQVAFLEAVTKTNKRVLFVRTPSGGHYEPMINTGIPRVIKWFQSLK